MNTVRITDRPTVMRPVSHRRGISRRERWTWLTWVLVVAVAIAYAAVVAAHLHDTITNLLWNSDYAGGFTLPESIARIGDGGNTVISTTGAWMDLWYGLVTAHLSFHRQLWEISPLLLFFITAALIGYGTWRVSGAVAGVGATLIVLMASPWLLIVMVMPVAHNTVYPTTAALAGALPWVLRRRLRSRVAWAGTILCAAAFLGADIASDKLVLVTAVLPLAVTAIVALWQRDRTTRFAAAGVLATLVLSIPAIVATNAIMTAAGYSITSPPLKFASPSSWGFHLRLLWTGLRDFGNAYLVTDFPGGLNDVLGVICTVTLVLALGAVAVAGARAAIALLRTRTLPRDELARSLHIGFWFASSIVVIVAFVCTTADGGNTSNHDSYFLTIVFAVAAVVPVLAVRRAVTRMLVPLALVVFAGASLVGVSHQYEIPATPLAAEANTIVNLARTAHATDGYAGYWDASSLTWGSKGAVTVRPLEQCANPDPHGAAVCPFLLMRTASWYRPQPRRTFLLVDPDNVFVTALPAGLGRPSQIYRVGRLQMYIYPYDIASRLGPYPVWPY